MVNGVLAVVVLSSRIVGKPEIVSMMIPISNGKSASVFEYVRSYQGRGLFGIAFATESVCHIKLSRSVNSSGQAPSLQIWKSAGV